MQDPKHDEAGHIRNIMGAEAIQKLQQLAEDARTCMFLTQNGGTYYSARPMALIKAEDDGSLYFFSAASSDKNRELSSNPSVQLLFANSASSEYLDVMGNATITRDRAKMESLWTDFARIWFQEGVDDPDLTLIQVVPESCRYWDTKHNKLVQWIKMGVSLVSGTTMDDGVEGKLSI